MLVLGIESSCDETGVALVELTEETKTEVRKTSQWPILLAQALHSQIALHSPYGGVVP